ncbi:MAG: flavin reductase family protein [Idiomarina sp.]|nr:flavin reductase family protein [Idiomarina sp.]
MYWFTQNDLNNLPSRYRARLVNSLSGFKSANLIGTANSRHEPNVAIVSSVVHLGASPPLLGMVMRPATVRRDTLNNIRETQVWTVNAVTDKIFTQAHQTAASYPADTSEFSAVGLTPHWTDEFAAPAVAESPLSMGLKLVDILPIRHNGTEFVIGEIDWLHIRGDALLPDGYLDIEALGLVAVSGLDGYHQTQKHARLSYAEPDSEPAMIPEHGAGDIEPAVDLRPYTRTGN